MTFKSILVSVPFLAFGLVSVVGVTSTQVACSSTSSKTCSQSEDQACTDTYTTCTTAAATAADKVACQKCIDDYCSCYDNCGNTCDKQKLAGQCTQ